MNRQSSTCHATVPNSSQAATESSAPLIHGEEGISHDRAPMSAQRLLELYERVTDAPDAVELLRQFVLDLAVRGKLAEPDPADDPVSVLVDKMEVAKAQLARDRLTKKRKPTANISPNELPIKTPSHWTWLRLSDIGLLAGGMTPSKSKPDYWDGDIVWLSPKDIKADEATDSELKISSRGLSETRLQLYPVGSLFMVARSGILKRTFPVSINRVPASCNQDIKVLVPYLEGQEQYLQVMFRGLTDFILSSLVKTGTTVQSLKYAEFAKQPFPIPPMGEQQRIVAKVKDLMALLDRLETMRTRRETTRNRLTTASLARLNRAEITRKDLLGHARFALDNLQEFTTRPDQIQGLRQTIINLGVGGMLVEQRPNDEPASELLRRLTEAKAAAKHDTGDRRIKQAPTPKPESLPIDLPAGWSVQSFENVFLFIDYRGRTPPKTAKGVPLITAKNVRMGVLNREPREFVSQSTFDNWMTRGLPKPGDLFFTTEAPLANICVNNITESFALAQRVICFQPYGQINTRYFMFAIMSDLMQDLISEHSTGLTAKGIKASKLKPLPLPIPPRDEQDRIVAKINALLTLCDQMKFALTKADTTNARLLQTVLHAFLSEEVQKREPEPA